MPNDENLVATVHYVRDYTYSGSTEGNYSYNYSYQYDSEGNVSRLKITHDTYDYFYITPTYDGLNRLSAKTVMLRGSSSDTVSVGYSYTYKGGTVDGTSTTSVAQGTVLCAVPHPE